jgi:hypothetical protein
VTPHPPAQGERPDVEARLSVACAAHRPSEGEPYNAVQRPYDDCVWCRVATLEREKAVLEERVRKLQQHCAHVTHLNPEATVAADWISGELLAALSDSQEER